MGLRKGGTTNQCELFRTSQVNHCMNWIDNLVNSSPSASSVAFAGEVSFASASESDSSGRRVKFRVIQSPEEQLLVHPFARFTRRQRGRVGTRFEGSFVGIGHNFELMTELQLVNWQSVPKGAFVEFFLTFESDKHPFMGFVRESATTPGTRWMLVAAEKNDDEQIIQQDKRERAENATRTGRRQTLSNVARLLTKNPMFWEFLREHADANLAWDTAQADAWIKTTCGINSKADLDSEGPEAVAPIVKFHRVRQAFVNFQETGVM